MTNGLVTTEPQTASMSVEDSEAWNRWCRDNIAASLEEYTSIIADEIFSVLAKEKEDLLSRIEILEAKARDNPVIAAKLLGDALEEPLAKHIEELFARMGKRKLWMPGEP
jgi:hypothetical protein